MSYHKNILFGICFASLIVLLSISIPLVFSQTTTPASTSTDNQNSQLISLCKEQGFISLPEGQQITNEQLQECFAKVLNSGDKDLIKSVNFKNISSELFNNPKVSEAILGNSDILAKYNKEILGEKFALDKEDVSGATLSKEGMLKLANGNEYNLTAIKGKQVIIQQNRIVIDPSGADVNDFSGISKGNGYFELKEGSNFKLDGESFVISGKNAFVDSSGNIFLPAGAKATVKGFTIENPITAAPLTGEAPKEADWVHVSLDKKSFLDNAVSWDSSGNIYLSSSKDGKYLVYDSKNDLGVFNEKGASLVLKNDGLGNYKVSSDGYLFNEFRNSDGSYMTDMIMAEGNGRTLISTNSSRLLEYNNLRNLAVLNLGNDVSGEKASKMIGVPEELKSNLKKETIIKTNDVNVKTAEKTSNSYKSSAGIWKITNAIPQKEGYTSGKSRIAVRNNNPGNLIYSEYLAKNFGAEKSPDLNEGGLPFAKFIDSNAGLSALADYVKRGGPVGPDQTVEQFFNMYAPGTSDYADFVSKKTGIPKTAKLKDLL